MLERHDEGGIARLTMNAPERLNALSDAMLAALSEAFDTLAADPSTRVIVLAGSGKAFCAGHDLKEMQAARQSPDGGAAYFDDLFGRCAAMMTRIRELPQPVIAEVGGIAAAAGCQLVASCDMAVAAEGTRFGVNGVNIGLFCSTPMVALSRNVGRKRAMEMLLTGDMLSAADAVHYGLINRAVPAAELLPHAIALAERIAAKSPLTVAIGKRAFYAQAEMPLSDAYAYASQVMVDNMMARDAEEGIGAFLGKRKPEWKGR
jgi:enoyl-CoA hydratase/carnithine racemase